MDGGEGRGGEKRRDIIHIGHSICLALLAWVLRGGAEFEQCQIPVCTTSVAVLLHQDTKPLKSSILRIQGTCSHLKWLINNSHAYTFLIARINTNQNSHKFNLRLSDLKICCLE